MPHTTRQFHYVALIMEGLDWQFRNDPTVFGAGMLSWYPDEANLAIRQTPGVMVVEGRPKGDRSSYRQWEEVGITPRVVFDLLPSPPWHGEMIRKFQFYQRCGVDEYYAYDPERGDIDGWLRKDDLLVEIPNMEDWVSPRLKVKFTLENGELVLYHPDGSRFLTYVELARQREQAQRLAEQEREARQQAERLVQRLLAEMKAHGIEPPADAAGGPPSPG